MVANGKPGALSDSWMNVVGEQFEQPYMDELRRFLAGEKNQGKVIYPPGPEIFNALNHTPFERVKVVILGQDPYHGPGQAHGFCFSVQPGVRPPPSLINIFREIEQDVGDPVPSHGTLTPWADQGVLLLNAVLTVEAGKPGSHQGRGWERFTDSIITALSTGREGVVFMLWGAYAQKKGQLIDRSRHLVLQAPHPSPLAAHRGFFGCRHFSQANHFLVSNGQQPIHWGLPNP